MEKKTCIRQLFKLIPKTSNMQTALHADEKHGTELYKAAAERTDGDHGPAPEPEPLVIDNGGAIERGGE